MITQFRHYTDSWIARGFFLIMAVSFVGWSGLAGGTETTEISTLAARIAAATSSLERITK